ncbi:nuclear envelope protein [Spathaspora passalidarum NRRL Y-27907]|uniref:Nuclear envelope protein n=1 Tax=Spathaspora passalidarum (strain NRRL Y-27907 / 11-Y1) TaxID=619300 RepID=G3ATS0_SPAPN|nr:nuclear envelope protein [Spathaspora passalidarum NRRL Y-27907]EGW30296.1 nuclear envelope protein [Spathaspora passalidarum NRRL Y-27907]
MDNTSKMNNYQYIFTKVMNKRLKFILNINIIMAVIISITLRLPCGQFWWNLIWTFAIRGPALFTALSLIRQARKKFSTVDYSVHKSLGSQIYHSVFSMTFVKYSLFYVISSYLIHAVYMFQLPFAFDYYLLSKEYRQNPLINDEWVYYWYCPLVVALLYSSHHIIFQRNRLQLEYGNSKRTPEKYLFSRIPQLIGHSLGLSIIIAIVTPLSYYFFKPLIYKTNVLLILLLGLDPSIPPSATSFKTYLHLAYVAYTTYLGWEIANHTFEVYATIGCLDGNKPISTYSADPINCLLSGLRNVDPQYSLSRVTAFQELAYISMAKDPEGIKLRNAIYNARNRKGYLWPAIFDECSLVIKEMTDRVNYRSISDLKALKEGKPDGTAFEFSKDDNIFGNSFISSVRSSPVTNIKEYKKEEPTKSKYDFIYTILAKNKIPLPKITNHKLITALRQKYQIGCDYYNKFSTTLLNTWIGVFFRTTLKRDTESRVINPVNFGNAVIAVANLLIHSIEEDKNNTITANDVCQVLNLFERPIRACSNYIDYVPASVYVNDDSKNNLVGIVHDLTMHEFYELCVKFNGKLNDLVLTPKTYKLAKWVIDVAIAEQQKRK